MLFQDKKIAFVGAGVMAEAMIAGLIREQVAPVEALTAAGPRQERGAELHLRYGIATTTSNTAAVEQADVVVLSVKPQTLDKVLDELEDCIPKDALVLSIIAGAPIKKISKKLNHTRVVRSMPNTPATIGRGITVWTAAPSVTPEQHEMAASILRALGKEIFMEDEKYLDMATALSGTGPAYVYLFMESWIDAGVHLGFPRRIAEALVIETIIGSVEFYQNSDDERLLHPARLRNQVTSPGGTTAAAMYFLEKAGFRTALSRAIWAAYERSRELGKDPSAHAPD